MPLDLVLQLGPCRVQPVGRRLLQVRGGSDQPAVVAAIRRAGGERDGTRDFYWLEALRAFAAEFYGFFPSFLAMAATDTPTSFAAATRWSRVTPHLVQ